MVATTGTFSGVGANTAANFQGNFNITLAGTFVGTVQPERSFDGGGTFTPFCYSDGTPLQWPTPTNTTLHEPERGVMWRLNCTSLTSGTIAWRMGQ